MLELPPLQKVFGPHAYEYDHLPAYLQFISQKLVRKHWYFGHYHVDKPDFKVMSSSSAQPEGHQYSALYYKNIQTIERIINFNDVLKAAYNGDPEAMRDLGMMYFMGQGIGKNYAEAVRWSEKAAENGDPDAMFNLCLIYSSDGAAKNSLKAYEWLMKAIDNNNSRASAFIVDSKTMASH
jgi:hypothetical protein